MKKTLQVLYIACACLLLSASVCQAAIVTAGSTYAQVTDPASSLDGWYRYEVKLTWDLTGDTNMGLSHFDIDFIQSIDCPAVLEDIEMNGEAGASQYFQFEPADPLDLYVEGISGYSTPEDSTDETVPWYGYVAIGDAGIPGIDGPIAKYEQPVTLESGGLNSSQELGKAGTGTFWFYSVFAPGEEQTAETVWTDGVHLKAGNGNGFIGSADLIGYLPDCTTIPEPATLALLGLGGLLLRRKK